MAIDQRDHPTEEGTVSKAETAEAVRPVRTSSQEDLSLDAIDAYPLLATCLQAWEAARGAEALPASMEVADVPEAVLDYTMLLDYLPAEQDAAVRMVGNYIGEKAAFQAHGMTVRAFFEPQDAEIVTDSLRRIAEHRAPSLARRSFVPIAGAPMSYERLILPLSANGEPPCHNLLGEGVVDPQMVERILEPVEGREADIYIAEIAQGVPERHQDPARRRIGQQGRPGPAARADRLHLFTSVQIQGLHALQGDVRGTQIRFQDNQGRELAPHRQHGPRGDLALDRLLRGHQSGKPDDNEIARRARSP